MNAAIRGAKQPGSKVLINSTWFNTRGCPYPSTGVEVELHPNEWTWFSPSAFLAVAKMVLY